MKFSHIIIICLALILIIVIYKAYFIENLNKKEDENEDIEEDSYENQSIRDESLYEKKLLLTKAEYLFWKCLKVKCDMNEILICPKVRMEDFIYINTKDFKTRQKHRGHIKSRHIDFILCDIHLNIIAGIELDDSTHNKEEVKIVDEMKDKIFTAINIPLFRIPVRTRNYEQEIEKIFSKIELR